MANVTQAALEKFSFAASLGSFRQALGCRLTHMAASPQPRQRLDG